MEAGLEGAGTSGGPESPGLDRRQNAWASSCEAPPSPSHCGPSQTGRELVTSKKNPTLLFLMCVFRLPVLLTSTQQAAQ